MLRLSSIVVARRAVLNVCSDGVGACVSSFSSAADANNDEDKNDLPSQPSSSSMQQRARRRTRRKTTQPPDGAAEIPSLAEFMHRAKVRKQYRQFVGLAQFVDGKDTANSHSVGECRAALEEVRLSYKMGMKKDTDDLSKSMAFSEGERRLRELEAMVGYSANRKPDEQSSNAMSPESYDTDSWINIKDEEDPRGRVGVQWPWEEDEDVSK